MLRIPADTASAILQLKLLGLGLDQPRAELCARLFVAASRDGVASHGLNRFPGFIAAVRAGVVDLTAQPERVASLGALERWDGRRGAGNLNAHTAMARALDLARAHGLGGVALANTNHWMRGANYGWQAAEAGQSAICWTNTMPNMPPWGAQQAQVGNNPLVIAVPRASGHIVLDMAMSQFSYGALVGYARRGETLPVPGGLDAAGQPSRDAQAVLDARQPLPIGYWKGSGLALMLDLLAALLTGGQATHQIGVQPQGETAVSQVFLAFNPRGLDTPEAQDHAADQIVRHFLGAEAPSAQAVRYPGERTLADRAQNTALGIPVDPEVWQTIQTL